MSAGRGRLGVERGQPPDDALVDPLLVRKDHTDDVGLEVGVPSAPSTGMVSKGTTS